MEKAGNEQGRRDALPRGAALRDYTIEAVLGHGGFGIVYRARHNELGNRVAIKEYLPAELALREGASVHPRSEACRAGYEDGLRRFRDEARALIEFQAHPSIVSCRDFFRENGTAYLVMEYEEGLSLSELLHRREASGRPFDEADLLAVMVPLLEGLRRVHEAEMLHRDIKPSNILVRRADERPVLIDFGAAKQGVAEHSKSLAPYTEGYAAWEQVGEGKLGPWTDLYAVGAVMWRIVAGGNPPWEPPHPVKVEKRVNAAMRGEADPMPLAHKLGAGRFSAGVLDAVDRCLKLNEKERVPGCGELLGLLRGSDAAESSRQEPGPGQREAPSAAVPKATPQVGNEGRSRRMPAMAWLVLAAAAWFWVASWNGSSGDAALARAEAAWNGVRDARDVESLRAYIEEYEGVEGAGEWVGQAESLIEELDSEDQEREAQAQAEEREREAVRRREESRAAWGRIEETQSDSVLTAYIARWKLVSEAAEFVKQARSRLDDLVKVRKAKEEAEKARAEMEMNRPVERIRDCDVCPQMVVMPAGSFLMGSPEGEEGRGGQEGPQHRVEIRDAFAVGVYEVTFEEWDACGADGGCGGYRPDDEGWGRGLRPVINMSWRDAQAYVSWLRGKTGEEYRLLSEAEWEYAARAGMQTRYWWGDEIGKGHANCYGCGSRWDNQRTAPVGSFRANGYGLQDLYGNVWEWVQDCYNGSYEGAPNNGEAWERGDCSRRVLRGGSWNDFSRLLRSAYRLGYPAGSRDNYNGFRVARALAP